MKYLNVNIYVIKKNEYHMCISNSQNDTFTDFEDCGSNIFRNQRL